MNTERRPRAGWGFDEPKFVTPDPVLDHSLNKLFALEPALTAIVFVWQSAGHNGTVPIGGEGFVEYETVKHQTRAEIAAKNQAFAATAWVFESQVINQAKSFLVAKDGGASAFICLRGGYSFVVDDTDLMEDPSNRLDMDALILDGKLKGISMAVSGVPSGHEQIAAMEQFVAAYPWFCQQVDEIVEINPPEDYLGETPGDHQS